MADKEEMLKEITFETTTEEIVETDPATGETTLAWLLTTMDTTPLLPPGISVEIGKATEWAEAGAKLGQMFGGFGGKLTATMAAAQVNAQVLADLLGKK